MGVPGESGDSSSAPSKTSNRVMVRHYNHSQCPMILRLFWGMVFLFLLTNQLVMNALLPSLPRDDDLSNLWILKRHYHRSPTFNNKTTTKTKNPKLSTSSPVIIDVVSIGSVTQADLQQAQYETFGKNVRHFYAATEVDDVEQDCYKQLTWDHVQAIVQRCRSKHPYPVLRRLRYMFATLDFAPLLRNPSGWICAQKRPLNALRNFAHKYYNRNSETASKQDRLQLQSSADFSASLNLNISLLPDYLILGDDDTWINIDALKSTLPQLYPSNQPRAVAGCLIRSVPDKNHFITLPFGGFGLVLTRSTLVHLLRPFDCSASDTTYPDPRESRSPFSKHDDFEALVCWRLQKNLIGEREVYRQGMSLLDMMYQYSVAAPYLQVKQWGNRSFCLHSDWVWGYLVNYYHMARHSSHGNSPKLPSVYKTNVSKVLHDRLEGYNHSQYLPLMRPLRGVAARHLGQCRNSNDYNYILERSSNVSFRSVGENKSSPGDAYCDQHAHFCHRLSSSHMRQLHQCRWKGH